MILNKIQREALYRLYERSPYSVDGKGYLAFRRTVRPMFMEPQVAMVPFCGMTVGIEPDGYTHS